jgi:hypothetical protein
MDLTREEASNRGLRGLKRMRRSCAGASGLRTQTCPCCLIAELHSTGRGYRGQSVRFPHMLAADESVRQGCLYFRCPQSVSSALLSCKFTAACEDFFGLTAQLIHSRPVIGYGNSPNFVLSHRHSLWSPVPSAPSAVKTFGCGGAALGNPRSSRCHLKACDLTLLFSFRDISRCADSLRF